MNSCPCKSFLFSTILYRFGYGKVRNQTNSWSCKILLNQLFKVSKVFFIHLSQSILKSVASPGWAPFKVPCHAGRYSLTTRTNIFPPIVGISQQLAFFLPACRTWQLQLNWLPLHRQWQCRPDKFYLLYLGRWVLWERFRKTIWICTAGLLDRTCNSSKTPFEVARSTWHRITFKVCPLNDFMEYEWKQHSRFWRFSRRINFNFSIRSSETVTSIGNLLIMSFRCNVISSGSKSNFFIWFTLVGYNRYKAKETIETTILRNRRSVHQPNLSFTSNARWVGWVIHFRHNRCDYTRCIQNLTKMKLNGRTLNIIRSSLQSVRGWFSI